MSQSHEEITRIYQEWVAGPATRYFPTFSNTQESANLLHGYLTENGQEYSLQTLTEACVELTRTNRLQQRTAAEDASDAARAEAERQQKVADQERQQKIQTAVAWLKDHCPAGILTADGQPMPVDTDRIVEFIRRNYNGAVSFQALDDAIRTLEPVLTWFSTRPEDRVLRNQPAAPPRNLSRQAKLEAGLLPSNPNAPISHTHDTPATTAAELLQKKAAFEKRLGIPTEEEQWQAKAEALVVQGKRGIDWPKSDQLRQVFAKDSQTGKISWKRTFEERNRMAEILERAKNR